MEWLIVAGVAGVTWLLLHRRQRHDEPRQEQPTRSSNSATSPDPEPDIVDPEPTPDERAWVDREAERIMAEVQEAQDAAMAEALDDLDGDDEAAAPTVRRSDYVPKEDEARYMTRDENGLPTLRLVDAGDRLAIWSPLDGGALINPKGPGLRSLGLVTTTARGVTYYPDEYRAADLRHGRPVQIVPEPDNPHGRNALALHSPGAPTRYAYVQRGRSPAVRRMLAVGPVAAVSLAGPGPGDADRANHVLIGPAADIEVMLHGD